MVQSLAQNQGASLVSKVYNEPQQGRSPGYLLWLEPEHRRLPAALSPFPPAHLGLLASAHSFITCYHITFYGQEQAAGTSRLASPAQPRTSSKCLFLSSG